MLLAPAAAYAEWIVMSLESAVKNSDIIVVGTLRNVSEETRDGTDYGSGEIVVDEVLSGKAEPGQRLSLVWENEHNVMCPRVEHRADQDKRLIWLLTLRSGDKVAADNPGRVVPLEKREKVLEILRGQEKSKSR